MRISVNRTGSIQTAVLPGGFRYAVSYEDLVYKHMACKNSLAVKKIHNQV